jgi:tetratricopeptide (TPR) repeat protein
MEKAYDNFPNEVTKFYQARYDEVYSKPGKWADIEYVEAAEMIGISQFINGLYGDCVSRFVLAIILLKRKPPDRKYYRMNLFAGIAYFRLGNLKKSEQYLKEAVDAPKASDPDTLALALCNLAILKLRTSQVADAAKTARESLDIATKEYNASAHEVLYISRVLVIATIKNGDFYRADMLISESDFLPAEKALFTAACKIGQGKLEEGISILEEHKSSLIDERREFEYKKKIKEEEELAKQSQSGGPDDPENATFDDNDSKMLEEGGLGTVGTGSRRSSTSSIGMHSSRDNVRNSAVGRESMKSIGSKKSRASILEEMGFSSADADEDEEEDWEDPVVKENRLLAHEALVDYNISAMHSRKQEEDKSLTFLNAAMEKTRKYIESMKGIQETFLKEKCEIQEEIKAAQAGYVLEAKTHEEMTHPLAMLSHMLIAEVEASVYSIQTELGPKIQSGWVLKRMEVPDAFEDSVEKIRDGIAEARTAAKRTYLRGPNTKSVAALKAENAPKKAKKKKKKPTEEDLAKEEVLNFLETVNSNIREYVLDGEAEVSDFIVSRSLSV